MIQAWKQELREAVSKDTLSWDEASLYKYSRDYHYFSPILERELEGKIAECIATPMDKSELKTIIRIAFKHNVPLTPRGGGTANYGQCVPLSGGIVVDLTRLDRIIKIGDGYVSSGPGTKIGKLEAEVRKAGYELRLLPSTYQTATIAGYISGGNGGVGSINHGTIYDGMVLGLEIMTVEAEPRCFWVEGMDTDPYLHTYGTLGFLTEVKVATVPKVEWSQYLVSFEAWPQAVDFSKEVATDDSLVKRLVSVHQWPVPAYFIPLKLPKDRHVAFLEIAEGSEAEFAKRIEKWNGRIEFYKRPELYHTGLGVSDFCYGHTTLWVRKTDPNITYLQVGFDCDKIVEQTDRLQAQFPEVMLRIEFGSRGGKLMVTGSPLFPFSTAEHIEQIVACCEAMGVTVDNPHTTSVSLIRKSWQKKEKVGHTTNDTLSQIKVQNDPGDLLNQQKFHLSKAE